MEHGFFHPSRGYWQTNSEPPQNVLDGYPDGTVEVPLKPGPDHEWDGAQWVYVAPDPDVLRSNTRTPRAKFAIAAAKAGLITETEAEEWAAGASVPQWVSDALEAAVTGGLIPEEERLGVRIAVRTQGTIGRTDRLIPILADSAGLTLEQVDALFGIDV